MKNHGNTSGLIFPQDFDEESNNVWWHMFCEWFAMWIASYGRRILGGTSVVTIFTVDMS